jgi:hypothetical protein
MQVINTGTLPNPWTGEANKVYVIASGTYIRSQNINLGNCSAIVSSGTVILKKNASTDGIYLSSKNNIIVDNIQIN